MIAGLFSRAQGGRSNGAQACVPPGERLYVCGDIHGRLDALDNALDRIDEDVSGSTTAYKIVFLGDYIDRGPQSAYVIERLLQVRREYDCVFIKGNHESMLLAALRDASSLTAWARAGGLATLVSYGIAPTSSSDIRTAEELREQMRRALPPAHLQFLEQLSRFYVSGGYFFAHAGVKPGRQLMAQREEDLLWIRDEFLRSGATFEKIVVHGHTPVPVPDIRPNRINIDTGAYVTGRLACLVLEGTERRFL